MADRKFFVGGNWKLNGTKKEIEDLTKTLAGASLDPKVGEAFHSPQISAFKKSNILRGFINSKDKKKNAGSGEVH
jgi:triosephosphate isomerase